MRIIPRTVQRLITQSSDAQRVGDALTATVQPTLDFLNAFFSSTQDGSLQVRKPTTVQQTLTVSGQTILQGVITGNINVNILGANVIICNNAINGASFSSAAGFKSQVFGGTYGNSMASAATSYQCTTANGISVQNRLISMPFAGSLVGISVQYQGSTTQSSISVQVNKNNAALWPMTQVTSGATGAYGNVKAAKGVYPFAINDFITVLCQFGTAGSVQLQVDLFIEMTA